MILKENSLKISLARNKTNLYILKINKFAQYPPEVAFWTVNYEAATICDGNNFDSSVFVVEQVLCAETEFSG